MKKYKGISMKINNKITLVGVTACLIFSMAGTANALSEKEALGKKLYFDENLSEPNGQACASCHLPSAGFADPDQNLPVSEGVIASRFGGRNSPTASYAVFFPEFTLKGGVRGGQFWDGRAANLVEQAKGPFLNPLEMNNPDKASVISDVAASTYAADFEAVYGNGSLNNIEQAYDNVADAIASYESSSELSPFTSKYDEVKAGRASFTVQEQAGFDLFSGRGKCTHCHGLGGGKQVDVFSDFSYHNIGLPRNTEYPYSLIENPVADLGLGGVLNNSKYNGQFKTSHLRNISATAPYMHNGVLKTLKEVVHFYNTRDVPGVWPASEVNENISSSFVGDLGLSDAEEDAIVSFMETLTDSYVVAP